MKEVKLPLNEEKCSEKGIGEPTLLIDSWKNKLGSKRGIEPHRFELVYFCESKHVVDIGTQSVVKVRT